LRYILDDIKEQANIVEKILSNRVVLLFPEVVAEALYVLIKSYDYNRAEAADMIEGFLDDVDCQDAHIINAVAAFGATKLDFVDCLLYEYSKNPEYEVFTFDKDLKRLIDES
jgi:predicted nucleic-acid-binding protein